MLRRFSIVHILKIPLESDKGVKVSCFLLLQEHSWIRHIFIHRTCAASECRSSRKKRSPYLYNLRQETATGKPLIWSYEGRTAEKSCVWFHNPTRRQPSVQMKLCFVVINGHVTSWRCSKVVGLNTHKPVPPRARRLTDSTWQLQGNGT